MTEKIRVSRCSDDEEEEEDLELLRMVALKSIHLKKDNPPSFHQSPPQSRPAHLSVPASYTIPITQQQQRGHDNVVPVALSPQYYPPAHNLPPQPRILTNPLDNFNNRQRLEQLDINEPYVPQRVPPIAAVGPPPVGTNGWIPEAAIVGSNYAPYIPHKVNDTISLGPNVQLSPRSMAFVAKNNVILARRKGENISPNYAYRSPSPLYRHISPGRWSKSPSPQLKSNSRSPVHRNRPHQYNHRRSISRSPPLNRPRSPPFRRRSMTRSPPLMQQVSRHQSPNPFHSYPSRSPPPQNRRAKSRSPIGHGQKHKLSPRRHMSRSPPLQPSSRNGRPLSRSPPTSFNGRRRSPPLGPRHGNKNRRTPSPHNMKRSPGNMFYESGDPSQRHPNRGRSPQQMPMHRRSQSPVSLPPRQRSHSRSPPRKYQRRSRDRAVNTNNQAGNRRRSPYTNGRRRYDGPQNGFRNRGRKRSLSPSKDRLKKSRSKSADRNRRTGGKRLRRPEQDNRKADDMQRIDLKPSNDKIVKKPQNNDVIKGEEEENRPLSSTPPPVTLAEEISGSQIDEQATAAVVNDPKSEDKRQHLDPSDVTADKDSSEIDEDDDEDNDDDGIDLFASEESESENEGRFKSSTSKNERDTQAPTLSFTKLGETVPVAVKELNDLPNTTSNRVGNNDRNRSRSNNYGRSRGDHFRSTENSRNNRNDRRSKNSIKNNRRDRDRNRDWDGGSGSSKNDEKKSDDKPMFKATFQAVEGEGRSSRKNSRERDLTDRKSTSSNKRRNTSKDRKVSPETEMNIEQLPSAITLVSSSTSSTATTTKSALSPSRSASDLTSSGGSTGGKKPIHLRLGAMTNTFKPPKKPLTWNSSTSSEKVSFFSYLFKNLLSHPPSRVCCDYRSLSLSLIF